MESYLQALIASFSPLCQWCDRHIRLPVTGHLRIPASGPYQSKIRSAAAKSSQSGVKARVRAPVSSTTRVNYQINPALRNQRFLRQQLQIDLKEYQQEFASASAGSQLVSMAKPLDFGKARMA